MAIVDVDGSRNYYQLTHSPSRLAWSEGWRPPGAQSALINEQHFRQLVLLLLLFNRNDVNNMYF